jgi:hypothetical protein
MCISAYCCKCMCVLTYVSACCRKCMCVLILLYNMCVFILLHMYPHPAVSVCVSSYCCIICVSAYSYICIRILLYWKKHAEQYKQYMCHTCIRLHYACPHTTICVSSYYYISVLRYQRKVNHYICVLILQYFYCMCVFILLYVYSMCVHILLQVSCMCVLILLWFYCMRVSLCPHTNIFLSSDTSRMSIKRTPECSKSPRNMTEPHPEQLLCRMCSLRSGAYADVC